MSDMQFDTYGELIDSVVELVSHSNCRPFVPGWILITERSLRNDLRNTRDDEDTYTDTFVPDQNYIDMPADAIRPRLLEVSTTPKRLCEVASLDELIGVENQHQGLAYPVAMTLIGAQRIRLAPAPASDHSYTLYYYKRDGNPKANDAKPTSFLKDAPGLLYYEVAKHAAIWARDHDNLQIYKAEANTERAAYKKQLMRAKFSGGRSARMRANTPNDSHTRRRL